MPRTEKRTKNDITLGSGQTYMLEYSDSMPTIETLFVEENRIGYSKGGASLEYSQATYTEKDDEGYVYKEITTEEDAKLKLGLITWNGNTINNLIDRSSVTQENGRRIVDIGGKGNEHGGYKAVGFHHEDKQSGDIWIMLIGRNTANLTLAFSKEAGTLLEPEFTAIPHDSKGTLIKYIEQISDAGAVSATTVSGKASAK